MKKNIVNLIIYPIEAVFEIISVFYFSVALCDFAEECRDAKKDGCRPDTGGLKALMPTALWTQAAAGVLDKIRKRIVRNL